MFLYYFCGKMCNNINIYLWHAFLLSFAKDRATNEFWLLDMTVMLECLCFIFRGPWCQKCVSERIRVGVDDTWQRMWTPVPEYKALNSSSINIQQCLQLYSPAKKAFPRKFATFTSSFPSSIPHERQLIYVNGDMTMCVFITNGSPNNLHLPIVWNENNTMKVKVYHAHIIFSA